MPGQGPLRRVAATIRHGVFSEGLWISETRNLARFWCYQPMYNLIMRDLEQEILPLCRQKGGGSGDVGAP